MAERGWSLHRDGRVVELQADLGRRFEVAARLAMLELSEREISRREQGPGRVLVSVGTSVQELTGCAQTLGLPEPEPHFAGGRDQSNARAGVGEPAPVQGSAQVVKVCVESV